MKDSTLKKHKFQPYEIVKCACGFVARFRDLANHQKGCKKKQFSYADTTGCHNLARMEREQWLDRKKKGMA